jgi:hypothetical protein
LRICGKYTEADVIALGGKVVNEQLDEKTKKKAIALATQRAEIIKEYLVKEKNVDSKRLFICQPLWESEGNPRVDLLL